MEYKRQEAEYLLRLIAVALNDGCIAAPEQSFDWDNLLELATLHKVEGLAYIGMTKAQPQIDDAVMQKFGAVYKKAIVTEYVQHSEGVKLFKAFENAGISNIALKGWVIKNLYPQPAMRPMCDIDLLIHKEQEQQANEVMLSLGYDEIDFGKNPDIYFKKPVMNIEVHKALIRDVTDHFTTTWDRVSLRSGSKYMYEMSREDYYIFMMAHLKKHFVGTGTGIRSVADVWVYLKHYENELDWNYIREKLTNSGIWEFDRKIYDLCRLWFGEGESNVGESDFERELVYSAVYGTGATAKENTVAAQISNVSGGSIRSKKFRYMLSLFFPGKEIMTQWYPWVGKAPILLPLCWIMRGFVCVFSRNGHMRGVISDVANAHEDKINK